MRLRMPLIGVGVPDDPWRPRYLIPIFKFFYEGQEVISDQVQPHYDLPNLIAEVTMTEELGQRLLAKHGIEVGGDVEFISDETVEEGWARGQEIKRKALEDAERQKKAKQIAF